MKRIELELDNIRAALEWSLERGDVESGLRLVCALDGFWWRYGLTEREIEVLGMVAQGLTDAQVAEKLYISPRTVSKHLQSIYGKLQVNSRSAATSFALEHGIA